MLTDGRTDGQKNMFFLYYIDMGVVGADVDNSFW